MTEKHAQLSKIIEDLNQYTVAFCSKNENENGTGSDFAGEKCNDALLMLQDALSNLKK